MCVVGVGKGGMSCLGNVLQEVGADDFDADFLPHEEDPLGLLRATQQTEVVCVYVCMRVAPFHSWRRAPPPPPGRRTSRLCGRWCVCVCLRLCAYVCVRRTVVRDRRRVVAPCVSGVCMRVRERLLPSVLRRRRKFKEGG